MRILNVGSLNLDHFYKVPQPAHLGAVVFGTHLGEKAGGRGLHQSIALARAGCDVFHAGIVGNDGGRLLMMLDENCIDTRFVRVLSGAKTGHAILQIDQDGEHCALVCHGANHCVDHSFVDEVLSSFDSEDVLLLQNEMNCIDYLLEKGHERGMQIVFNPAPFTDDLLQLPLEYVDTMILNYSEGSCLTGETEPDDIMHALRERCPQAVIALTLGADGAILSDGTQVFSQESYDVPVRSTTAAGDVFLGFFVACYKDKRMAPDQALKLATKAAALTISRWDGKRLYYPTMREVQQMHFKDTVKRK